jgi:metacaspase-1
MAAKAKRALCIGINDYPGTGADLGGCVNDAHDWTAALAARGYTVTKMVDAEATKAAMVEAITALVGASRYGDRAVITYSGHGTWVPDRDGDEPDGRDEALVCHDWQERGLLTDDELLDLFARKNFGVRLVMISDSCHSGTVARGLAETTYRAAERQPRFLPPAAVLDGTELARARQVEGLPVKGLPRQSALLLAGCEDGQFSYDAVFGGRPNGAFTFYALRTLDADPTSYKRWHAAIRTHLGADNPRYPQTPQLGANWSQARWTPFE